MEWNGMGLLGLIGIEMRLTGTRIDACAVDVTRKGQRERERELKIRKSLHFYGTRKRRTKNRWRLKQPSVKGRQGTPPLGLGWVLGLV